MSAGVRPETPGLETPRLLLRPPELADWPFWRAHQADPVAMHETGPQAVPAAWTNFLAACGCWRLHGFGMFSVIDRSSGVWMGKCGPSVLPDWPGIELGWSLMPAFHGRGLAVEAAIAARDWLFGAVGLDRIVHTIQPANVASQRVAMRIGSWSTGPLAPLPPGVDAPNDLWVQTRAAWAARADA